MKSAWLSLLLGALLPLSAEPKIPRDRNEVRAFRAEHPCPATGRIRGACPGYHVDHVIPLCAGGLDRPVNMQWITREDHRWKTFVDVRECRKLKKEQP
ncbi:HNH endonuclease signature motif containing protein [Alicycliphilus denitrificans]|uniref:HNH endonuclease signature motif containing protein n=1 Tax=Alicycliphilus denitrificans TaxID=179636 RepID=UPI002155C2CE|nr:HNH endonuclease signature motif containing protein [Alicycliphilus denitrificans]